MALRLQPARIGTGIDEEGVLVWSGDRLVAVLVRLSRQHAEIGLEGRWFLEAGFGPLQGTENPVFSDLDAAQAWARERLG